VVFHAIDYILFVLSFQGDTLAANTIMVEMTMKGVVTKMLNLTTMTTMNNITMMGTVQMDRKLYRLEI
jgi:hypothetical protein